MNDLVECRCDCHRNDNVKHCFPCCHTCPSCKRRIRAHSYKTHVDQCGKPKQPKGLYERDVPI